MFKKLFGIKSSSKPSQPPRPKASSEAMDKFLKSMNISYEDWRNGSGYNLNVLKELSPEELREVEKFLIARKDDDFRDIEALAALGTPGAIQALKDCLKSPNYSNRFHAVKALKDAGIEDRVEEVILSTLHLTKISYGMVEGLRLAEKYPTEKVKHRLIWCTLHGNDDIRAHCAAMALYLYGKADSDFDNKQQIIFRVGAKNKDIGNKAFPEFCQILGVNPKDFAK